MYIYVWIFLEINYLLTPNQIQTRTTPYHGPVLMNVPFQVS